MLNIMLTRKYALFEQETKRTDFFFNTLYVRYIYFFEFMNRFSYQLGYLILENKCYFMKAYRFHDKKNV